MKEPSFYFSLIIIGLFYFFFRFNHLSQNLVFRPDQGLHLLESYQMVENRKIRLLGPVVSSKSFDNRNFFIGGSYYYALAALGLATDWNPLGMTILYGIIEFIFILAFIFWLKNKFNSVIAITTFLFISCSNYLISHSRFYWNPHFLVPFGILEVYFLDRFITSKKIIWLFMSSFIWGVAFSFHYASILWLFIYLFILLKKNLLTHIYLYPLVTIGFILGDLPFFISEFIHNFYNFKTILFVYSHSSDSSQLYSHYFIYPFLIFILYIFAWYLHRQWQNITFRIIIPVLLFFLMSLAPPVDELSSIKYWRYPDQIKVLNIILSGSCPKNYNIASTISGDTRTYDLRSLLTVKGCPPLSVEQYPQASTIFLLAYPDRPPETETVWEISSYQPFKVKSKIAVNNNLFLYQLTKTPSP